MGRGFTLTLFRHGLTTANEKKQYLGWTDETLNDRGRQEVAVTAKGIQGIDPGMIVSSDLKRCLETAEILFPNQVVEAQKAFREMHFGTFEKKTYDNLKNYQAYLDWINHPFQAKPEAGESFNEFSVRVMQGLAQVQANPQTNRMTIVTHGGVIRLFLSEFVKSNKHYFEWQVPNGSGYQLYWEDIEAFKGGALCTSLWAVPSMAKVNG